MCVKVPVPLSRFLCWEVEKMSLELQATPRFQLFSREQCEAVHHATLDILRRTGTRVYHPEARQLLRSAGCLISDDTLVRYPSSLVEWAIEQAPSTIALCERGSRRLSAPALIAATTLIPAMEITASLKRLISSTASVWLMPAARSIFACPWGSPPTWTR